jgi:dethiobiotin synthetase
VDAHSRMTRLVVVGTGTGVGKTHVSCSLIRAARLRGLEAIGLKPVETGVPAEGIAAAEPSDQQRLTTAALSFHVKHPEGGLEPVETGVPAEGIAAVPSDHLRLAGAGVLFHVKHPEGQADSGGLLGSSSSVASGLFASAIESTFHVKRSLYAFAEPISPHLAAAHDQTRIDLAAIRQWVLRSSRHFTLIETAGGLFSPLGASTTNLDLIAALLPARVLLVAPDRLGVLHDVTATIGLAAVRRFPPDAAVLSAPATPDASTGQNATSLASLGIASPLATFPRAADDDPRSLACANRVLDWLAVGQ